jgi:hypothetical protein
MAQDVEIKIKAAVEGAQAAQTLGSLKKALTELQQLAEETEIGSTQFQQLQSEISSTTNRLAETNDRLGDVGDKLRTLSGTPVERLNASFGLLKESIFNLDIDKAKIAVEGLVNSFTPLGADGKVLTGFKAIGPVLQNLGSGVASLGQSFVQMGRTLLMNPIFLLAATAAAITVAITALLNKLGLLKPLMDAIGNAVEFVSSAFDNLTEAIGLTTAASDRHLRKVKELGEEERAQIEETYRSRLATSTALEGLDSLQIRQIEKVTGFYLQQDKTLSSIQTERLAALRESADKQIKEYERIQANNGKLNEEQRKDLKELIKNHEDYSNQIVAIEAKKVQEIESLQNQITQSQINREQNEYKRAQMLRDFQVNQSKSVNDQRAILLGEIQQLESKTDAQSLAKKERLQKEVDLLGQRQREQEMTANIEYSRKVAELNAKSKAEKERLEKERIENEKKLVQSQFDYLKKENELIILNTKKGSKERLDAELLRINSELIFQEQNAQKLGIINEDLQIQKRKGELQSQELIQEYNKNSIDKQIKNKDVLIEREKAYREEVILIEENAGFRMAESRANSLKKELGYVRQKNDLELKEGGRTLNEILLLKQQNAVEEKKILFQIEDEYKKAIEFRNQMVEDNFKKSQAREEELLKLTLTFDKNKVDIIQSNTDRKKFILDNFFGWELQNEKDLFMLKTGLKESELASNSEWILKEEELQKGLANKKVELEKEAQERIKALKQKEVDDALQLSENGLGAIQNVSDAYFAIKMQKAKGNAVEEEKLARKQFEVNKALQVGAAIIDGFRAVQTSLAFAPLVIGPVPNPAGIANLAFTLVTSAANIAKILATQYQSKSFSPAGGGGGASIAASSAAGPSATFSPAQFFGLGGQAPVNVGVGGPNIVGPQKVFVVETDITSAQRSVRGIEQRAEIE